MRSKLPWLIAAAMLCGALTGWVLRASSASGDNIALLASRFSFVAAAFVRLIQMIIAPLVFATLSVGIARMQRGAALARTGARTAAWFLGASLVSLLVGVGVATLFRPGALIVASAAVPPAAAPSLPGFGERLIPSSIVQAMAGNEILQVVLFSVLFGLAAQRLGTRAAGVVRILDELAQVLLEVTGYLMWLAPVAVFAALAATVLAQGIGALRAYAALVGTFYLALAVLWVLLAGALAAGLGSRAWRLLRSIRAPILIAFSTASSEAAYPKTLERLEAQGVSPRIAAFVMPLGYSFNMDGAAMYTTFAVLFIAQAYRVQLGLAQQAAMLLMLLITGKGIAGVPRASIVIVAAVLAYLGLPPEGLGLILAVDHLLDMGRSATNVLGNAVAATLVAKWEGGLAPEPGKA
jgi:Na+/H+-dicarboxylate symporter